MRELPTDWNPKGATVRMNLGYFAGRRQVGATVCSKFAVTEPSTFESVRWQATNADRWMETMVKFLRTRWNPPRVSEMGPDNGLWT